MNSVKSRDLILKAILQEVVKDLCNKGTQGTPGIEVRAEIESNPSYISVTTHIRGEKAYRKTSYTLILYTYCYGRSQTIQIYGGLTKLVNSSGVGLSIAPLRLTAKIHGDEILLSDPNLIEICANKIYLDVINRKAFDEHKLYRIKE
jgi:hypothetical protein